jgi:hypothetical protein
VKKFRTSLTRLLDVSVTILAVGIALTLLYAGLLHLGNPYAHLLSIIRYDMLPKSLAIAASVGLPAAELMIATCLLLDIHRTLAFLGAMLLSGIFAAALLYASSNGLAIPCGCLSHSDTYPINYSSLLLPSVLFLASVLGVVLHRVMARRAAST